MPVLHVLRVFCDSEGQFGSPLGVVLDGPAIRAERRQPLAAELGFSETVYVDDPDTGQLRIFTPAAELPFADTPLSVPPGSSAATSAAINQAADATAVDAMTEPPHPDQDADQFWAWIDQQAGTVRDRVFAAGYGVPQDEACGSASMLLAAHLGRAITIQHGSGSVIQASPAFNGMADVGGRVVWDHERAVD